MLRKKISYVKFTIIVLLLLLGLYLNYYSYMPNIKTSIFGDDGDGFFNLWVLENCRLFLHDLNLNHYINTNIFYPENHLVLFWSDNLFVPGIIYSLFFYFVKDFYIAYNITSYIAIIASFITYYLFFRKISNLSLSSQLKPNTSVNSHWLIFFVVMLFTYNYTFSSVRIMYTYHFQNQWAFLVILGCYGLLQIMHSKQKIGIYIVSIVYLLLCYSAMYYAVVFAATIIFFLIYLFFSKGFVFIFSLVKKYWLPPILSFIISIPILLGYMTVLKRDTSQMLYTSKFRDLYIPIKGSFLYKFLSDNGIHVQGHSYESLVYIGSTVFLIALIIFIYYTIESIKYIVSKKNILYSLGVIFLINIVAWSLPKHMTLKPFFTTLSVTIILFYFIYCLSQAVKKNVLSSALAFLVISILIFYGIAFGYSGAFYNNFFNPSVYGILSIIIPGIRSMRAIGRIGALGSCILYSIILLFMVKNLIITPNRFSHKIRMYSVSIIVLFLCLNLIEQKMPPMVSSHEISLLKATPEEDNYLSNLHGNVIVFPVESAVTYDMIYFLQYRDLNIVNGYSGKNSLFLDNILKNYAQNIPALNFIYVLQAKNVHFLFFKKRFYSENELKHIVLMFKNITFNNNQFLIVKI